MRTFAHVCHAFQGEVATVERVPLGSVRVFSVVARLLSVTRAAEHMNISPSAVSHQIKTLEEYLATRLFMRGRNGLSLTASGRQYMAEISEGLFLISRATNAIRRTSGQALIRISATPGLATLWLIERVSRYMDMHSHVRFTLTARAEPLLKSRGLFEVGFCYGLVDKPNLAVYPLGRDHIFPVCRPSLVKGERPLLDAHDLANYTLIDSVDDGDNGPSQIKLPGWSTWLEAAGLGDAAIKRYLNVTPRHLVLPAVLSGQSVGLSRTLLAADALQSKQLIVPCPPVLEQPSSYQLVIPTALSKNPDVTKLRDYILAEAEASTKVVERMLRRCIRNGRRNAGVSPRRQHVTPLRETLG